LRADPPGPPSAPTASDVTKDSCTLTWRAPESDGGTEILGYQVERCLGQSSRWIRITKDPVPGLTYDVKVTFRVVTDMHGSTIGLRMN